MTHHTMSRRSTKAMQVRERERNVLFNDALNTFYLRLYGVRHMVKDHSDSEKGNLLPPHRLLLSINSKGSFICTIPQTGQCRRYPTAVNIHYYTQHSVHYPGFGNPNHLVVNQNYSQNTVSIIFQSYFHLTPVLELCVFAIKHTFKGEKKALQI